MAYLKLVTGETEEEYAETCINSQMHVKTILFVNCSIFVPSLEDPKLTFVCFRVGNIGKERRSEEALYSENVWLE
jgi:hypothetical protein